MTFTPIKIAEEQIRLIEKLSNAIGVSGDEVEIRRIILAELKGIADEIKIDGMGNVLVLRKAKKQALLRVMLDAHMDEVGFMIVEDEGNGIYRFELVGGIDERQLPGQPVLVGRDHLPGVIGTKAIHLTEEEERKSPISLESLRIDLGPEAAGKANPGDYATFATSFMQIGPSLRGKALDDRLGVATLIELVKRGFDTVDLLVSFSVQEEIGLRGARVSAFHFDPDLAIAVDSTPAFDLPREDGEENAVYNCQLGEGPAIYVVDAGTISDPRLIHFMSETGKKHNIHFQYRQSGGGGTNAGSIFRARGGIPVVSLSIPGRYAHTAMLMSRTADWQAALDLLCATLDSLDPDLLAQPRR
jgi:endoglucanase